MALTQISIYRRIFKIWRARRFAWFLERIAPSRTESLIDIGGDPGTWTAQEPVVASVEVVDVRKHPFDGSAFPEHAIRVSVADGCDLGCEDRAYDIAFSNSVIEHVGSREDQQRFAAEMRRCARKLWCQTPARECPIEPHYMAPFLHWLPRSWQRKLLRRFSLWGWLSKPDRQKIDFMVDTTRLLTKREMHELFPDCEILTERMLWILPKSYIAVRS